MRFLLQLSLFTVFCALFAGPAFSQQKVSNGRRTGIVADFVKNNTPQKLNEVASNVLKVVNRSPRTLNFTVQVNIPEQWQRVMGMERTYTLAVGDSAFIPVRVIPSAVAKGNTNYVVLASLIGPDGGTLTTVSWYVPVQKKSMWNLVVPVKDVYFTNDSEFAPFAVRLYNEGNADENIKVSVMLDRRLQLYDTTASQTLSPNFQLRLAVGVDTTLYFKVKRPAESESTNRRATFEGLSPRAGGDVIFRTTISAQNQVQAGETPKSTSGSVVFTKLGSEKAVHEFGRSSLPLTLEVNAFDFLTSATNLNILAYGTAFFENNSMLSYRLQTNFVSNYYSGASFLGNDHYIGYFAQKGSIEVGQISGFGRIAMFGRGVRSTYNIGKTKLGVAYVRSPELFGQSNFSALELYQRTSLGKLTFDTSLSRRWSDVRNSTSDLMSTNLTYRLVPNHTFTVGGGYSLERFETPPQSDSTGTGFTYNLGYSGRVKKLAFSANTYYASQSFLIGQGVNLFNSSAIYSLDRNKSINFQQQSFRRLVEPGSGIPGYATDRFDLRYGLRSLTGNLFAGPTVLHTKFNGYQSLNKGIRVEYSENKVNNMMWASSFFGSYISAYGSDQPDFFTASASLFARYRFLFARLFYFYGPNGVYQEMRFLDDGVNPQILNTSLSNELWFLNNRLMFQPMLNVSYESRANRWQANGRGRLTYFTKHQLELSIFGGYVGTQYSGAPTSGSPQGSGDSPSYYSDNVNIGFGLRKHFGVPLPGKKYHNVEVVIFKDLNGNGILDKNEDGMGNVLVGLVPVQEQDSAKYSSRRGEELMTESRGRVSFLNLAPGEYSVKVTPLSTTEGWFSGKEQLVAVEKSKVLYMPLRKGVRLGGMLSLERDQFSAKGQVDLSRIRVMAQDSSGRTFQVLTDSKGAFSMFLPVGRYTVSVNDAALGDTYTFAQSVMFLDLNTLVDSYNVTFYVAEKKRKINIKKFNNQGGEIKETSP